MRRFGRNWQAVVLGVCACALGGNTAWAAQVWLKDGRILEGKWAPLEGLAEVPKAPSPDAPPTARLIVMVDDELRRTFVCKRQIETYLPEDSTEIFERFRIRQQVARTGKTVQRVGPFKVEPFDEYGRRIVRMMTQRGPENIIQCITEITPLWTKVQGYKHVWDMRISTQSIPADVLAKILVKQTKRENIQQREKIARFYLQAQRYEEANLTLKSILADFPHDAGLRQRLDPIIRAIRQRSAQRLLDELKLRQQAGQHRLVEEKLKQFPSEGVAGNILEGVRQMIGEYESLEAQRKQLLEQFDALLGQLEDEGLRERIRPIREEIGAELNVNTIGRLAAFRLMLDDQSQPPEDKLSLAISGWLLGSNSATEKLLVALSVFEVRGLVRQYLSAPDALSRARILERFYAQEGGTPTLVAKLLAHMKPPVETPLPGAELELLGEPRAGARAAPGESAISREEATVRASERPGYYELEVPGLADAPPVRYLVQLPPEYDPYRRYPAILTLNGAGNTPAMQIDWWAGSWTPGGWRNGQASRHGYIVLAPSWAGEHQRKYQYSAQEHAAVLNALRDACRRFAIDTDRVFLSGHSMGGDAAWDIGLAHPDLWAGVIPIVARSDKYCSHYRRNARLVPLYFVSGELDGDKMIRNAPDLDYYLTHAGYNCTVVEYRGRGHEHFSDEIHRLFDWMGRFKRDFYPREFTVSTMRWWDNFFWWVELGDLPATKMVDPVDWPPSRGTRAIVTEAALTATNGVNVQRTGAGRVTVWLSPNMLNFDEPIKITVKGQRINSANRFLEPDLETLLEDVRTRGDRQHPFWIKVESPAGRVGR